MDWLIDWWVDWLIDWLIDWLKRTHCTSSAFQGTSYTMLACEVIVTRGEVCLCAVCLGLCQMFKETKKKAFLQTKYNSMGNSLKKLVTRGFFFSSPQIPLMRSVDRLGKLPLKEQQLSRTQHFILSSHAAMLVLHTQYGPCGIPLTPMIRQQNQGFWYFARSRSREFQVNPRNPAKFTKTREIPRNSLETFPNTCRHNIFESYIGCWGCLLAVNLLIYFEAS